MSDETAILQALTALEVDYWHEVDFNLGRDGHAFYVADGLFTIGDTRMEGREAISGFYRWRIQRGERTARHVVTNFRLDRADDTTATLRCILLLYAADGAPVLPSLPAILIADVVSDCIRGEDGRWLYTSHVLTPVFMGGTPPTVPPPGDPE
ncbi:nuclear transport factor 2 family protein [Rhodoplanes roseus]|uniref:SnoaL-like domain-containing protein n=1 Tax=Rhodoplanes roseus TaxID=29409 RepID=A0A327LAC2_9BRAD|nr:nuclear transport factor 2 family protein [Rhodoplanes roseus]RAI44678.1 hypothetical protein CH341_07990 [Rhodoplanes roseus]